jgi:hypothetical protein
MLRLLGTKCGLFISVQGSGPTQSRLGRCHESGGAADGSEPDLDPEHQGDRREDYGGQRQARGQGGFIFVPSCLSVCLSLTLPSYLFPLSYFFFFGGSVYIFYFPLLSHISVLFLFLMVSLSKTSQLLGSSLFQKAQVSELDKRCEALTAEVTCLKEKLADANERLVAAR